MAKHGVNVEDLILIGHTSKQERRERQTENLPLNIMLSFNIDRG
jgi:hypothetical protein